MAKDRYYFFVHDDGESIIQAEGEFPIAFVYTLLKAEYGRDCSLKAWKQISKRQYMDLVKVMSENGRLKGLFDGQIG